MDENDVVLQRASDIRKRNDLLGLINDSAEDRDIESVEKRFAIFTRLLKSLAIELNDGRRLLEVGSGANDFLHYMRSQQINAVGVEARPRGKSRDAIVAAYIEQLPFPDSTFEIVTSSLVFDAGAYNQNQRGMIDEIVRVLKPKGIYISRGDEFKVRIRNLVLVKRYRGQIPIKMYQKNTGALR